MQRRHTHYNTNYHKRSDQSEPLVAEVLFLCISHCKNVTNVIKTYNVQVYQQTCVKLCQMVIVDALPPFEGNSSHIYEYSCKS